MVLVRQEGLGMIKNVSQVFIDDKMVSRLCVTAIILQTLQREMLER